MLKKEEILLIAYFIAVIFFLILFVVIFFLAFQRKKNRYLVERFEAEKRFEKELVNSKLEIQEQTLKNIAWELHDNIGQLLSVANIQLNILRNAVPEVYYDKIDETKAVVTDSVQQVRALSKTLNSDVIKKNGLITSLQVEIERFNRLNFLKASLSIEGEIVVLKRENEIVIFRIIQEFLSNVMKHAKASSLDVTVVYNKDFISILVKDDGVGFDILQKNQNSGMETMRSRAALLGANFNLTSNIGEGTTLSIKYPYINEQ